MTNFFNPSISTQRRTYFLDLLLLVTVSALVFFPALGQNRQWASREVRHAEVIREMAENGDYLVPKLLGKVYYDKPPVMHAAAAALTRMVGTPSMTIARLPSAVAGLLGVLATYGVGLLLLDRRSALIGAIALIGIPGYNLMAREAKPDMILCFSFVTSCFFLCLGMKKQESFERIVSFILAGLLAGLGVVTKGPYGILFPVFFILLAPFRRQDLKRPRFDWIPFIFGTVIAIAIWAVPVYLRDSGEYLHKMITQPDLDVTRSENIKPFYYVWMGILHALPLSIFLPLAIMDLRRYGYSAPLAVAGAIFIVISCVLKKRGHYILPLYPFLALGIAAAIVRHSITSLMVRRAAWAIIPTSIIAFPIYFAIIQPRIHPSEEQKMVLAKDVLGIIKPNATIYCAGGMEEALAWVGRRHEGILELPLDSSANQVLFPHESGSYLVIDDQKLDALLKVTGPLPIELVLQRKVDHRKWMLFLLKEEVKGMP